MKLSQFRNFLAIADKGSVRSAARHLGLTQPALTRSMQELEKELNVSLFVRGARGVVLTEMGERFQLRARTVTNEVRRAEEDVAQMQGTNEGNLNIVMSTVPHIALFPYALREFRIRYPNVVLDVIDGGYKIAEGLLKSGALDFYIGHIPNQPEQEILTEKLFDNTRVILCRRGHPLRHARSLSELTTAEWMSTSITNRAEDELQPLFALHGLPTPRVVMHAHTALTYISTIAYSDLLTILPVQWAEFEMTRTTLDIIDVVEPLIAPPMHIVRRADLPLTPAAQYFCDMIRRASSHLVKAREAKQ